MGTVYPSSALVIPPYYHYKIFLLMLPWYYLRKAFGYGTDNKDDDNDKVLENTKKEADPDIDKEITEKKEK